MLESVPWKTSYADWAGALQLPEELSTSISPHFDGYRKRRGSPGPQTLCVLRRTFLYWPYWQVLCLLVGHWSEVSCPAHGVLFLLFRADVLVYYCCLQFYLETTLLSGTHFLWLLLILLGFQVYQLTCSLWRSPALSVFGLRLTPWWNSVSVGVMVHGLMVDCLCFDFYTSANFCGNGRVPWELVIATLSLFFWNNIRAVLSFFGTWGLNSEPGVYQTHAVPLSCVLPTPRVFFKCMCMCFLFCFVLGG
jgi:hypothetical protein